jgi:hypothetical protein
MVSFGDYDFALAMRDVIAGMVKTGIDAQRPQYRYASVTGIDRVNRKCTVRFPGDTQDSTVNLMNTQPLVVGQVVQVDGIGNDRYVSYVKGNAYSPLRLTWAATLTANAQLTANQLFYADATAAAIILTLPATAQPGDSVWIKRVDGSSFTGVQIKPAAGEKIEGVVNSSIFLLAINDVVIFTSTGNGDWVTARMSYGTSAPVPNAPVSRDANGRAQVVGPGDGAGSASDIATRAYVDTKAKFPFSGSDPSDMRWHYVGCYGEPGLGNGTVFDITGAKFIGGRFRKDSAGCVTVEGLLTGVTAGSTAMFTLPPGYRPVYNLIFQASVNGTAPAQIKISTTGDVTLTTSVSGYVSLDQLSFMSEDFNPPVWVHPALGVGWSNYADATFSTVRCYQESSGDVHLGGMVSGGAAGTTICQLPAGMFDTNYNQIYAVAVSGGFARIDITTTGAVVLFTFNLGGSNTWVSLDGIIISNPGGFWYTLPSPMSNSWVNYGSVYAPPQICFNKNGAGAIRGLIKNGVTTAPTTIHPAGSIPTPYLPAFEKIFNVNMNGGSARFDVLKDGSTSIAAVYNSATNAYLSLQARWYSMSSTPDR